MDGQITNTWPSGTACKWQILRDGFDSRVEPISFDILYIRRVCWLEERKLFSQSTPITVELLLVQYNLKKIA